MNSNFVIGAGPRKALKLKSTQISLHKIKALKELGFIRKSLKVFENVSDDLLLHKEP